MFLLHEMDSFAIIAKVSNLQWCCFSIREFEQLLQTLDRLIPVFNPIAFVLDKAGGRPHESGSSLSSEPGFSAV